MAGGNRKVRLESLLHREIATLISTEVRDPRIGFITITRVKIISTTADFDVEPFPQLNSELGKLFLPCCVN